MQLAILYVYTVFWRAHYGRKRTPRAKPCPHDHAARGESATIHYALKRVLMGIREARRIIRSLRVSNESQGALDSLERIQYEQDAFVRWED